MQTLSHWKNFLGDSDRTIECAEMRLLSSHDHLPPVFTGPGYIKIPKIGPITFTMFAASDDRENAARSLAESHKNPHHHTAQFRLQATDYQAVEWAGGWTRPELKGLPRVGYPLTGMLAGLTTQDTGSHVSQVSSVELLFAPPPWVPLEKPLVTVSTIEEVEVERHIAGGKQSFRLLDADIVCTSSPSNRALWLTASTSDTLRHPYAERWLSEPFRVLLGQLVYPRLTARNFGDGRAMIQLMRVPRFGRQPTEVSLLGEHVLGSGEQFWDLYKMLLAVAATAEGEDGHPNFDVVHPVTRYYEEIIQATDGSLWVLCMTLSGAVEGFIRLLSVSKKPKVDAELKELSRRSVITHEHWKAWNSVRHVVMHGKLISPWPQQDTQEQIVILMDLVRRLTHEFLRIQSEQIDLK